MREVVAAGSLNTVGRRTEGCNVEVTLQDLRFGVALFQCQRVFSFTQFTGRGGGAGSLHSLRVASLQTRLNKHVFNVLLSQGRGTLGGATGCVGNYRTQHTRQVHTLVLVETLVLNGHDSVLGILGNLG